MNWIKKRLDAACFRLWVKDNVEAMGKDNPLQYMFYLQVKLVYVPLLEKQGFDAVLDKHDEWLKEQVSR